MLQTRKMLLIALILFMAITFFVQRKIDGQKHSNGLLTLVETNRHSFADAKLVLDDGFYKVCKPHQPTSLFKKFFNAFRIGNHGYALKRTWLSLRGQSLKIWYNLFKNGQNNLYRPKEYLFNIDLKSPVGLTLIKDERNFICGQLLWANEDVVTLGSLSSSDSLKFLTEALIKQENMLAVFSATFQQNNELPEGFFSHAGRVINPCFNEFWDALFIVEPHRTMIANLNTREIITCPAEGKMLVDNQKLPNFHFQPGDINTSAFQLPLLVFNHQLLIGIENANYRLRELRILGKITTNDQTENYWFLLNHQQPDFLPGVLYGFMQNIEEAKLKVAFAVLLDVGANNYLQIFNTTSMPDMALRGLIPINHARHVLYMKMNKEYLPASKSEN